MFDVLHRCVLQPPTHYSPAVLPFLQEDLQRGKPTRHLLSVVPPSPSVGEVLASENLRPARLSPHAEILACFEELFGFITTVPRMSSDLADDGSFTVKRGPII